MTGASSAGRFLIVRLGSLGDVVHAIPAAAALRAYQPSALIPETAACVLLVEVDGTEAAVEEKYGPRVDGTSPTKCFLALLDGRPIGMVQTYRVGD